MGVGAVLGKFYSAKDTFGEKIFKTIMLIGIGVFLITLIIGLLSGVSIDTLVFWFFGGAVGFILIALAYKGFMSMMQDKPFSPQDAFKKKLIKLCLKAKPTNVFDLYLRGEDMRQKSFYGKILGLGFIPYFVARVKKDGQKNIVYKQDSEGKILTKKFIDLNGNEEYQKIPETEIIKENDGDIVFLVAETVGFLGVIKHFLAPSYEIIRVNKKYCSDLIGDVFIKDVNLFPIGDYMYPAKQCQEDIIRIQIQDQAETAIQTHKNWLDLMSQITQMSLGSDPTFQKMLVAQAETLQKNQSMMPMQ